MAVVKFMSPEHVLANQKTSQKQILANQQNAKKSTGPEGKARSSRNAIKHGLLAKGVVINSPLGSEDRADFDALLADLCEELQPEGLIEQTLVERIATCYWRLHRAQRFESGSTRESLEVADDRDQQLALLKIQLPREEKLLAAMDRLAELFDKPSKKLTDAEAGEVHVLIQQFPPSPLMPIFGLAAFPKPETLPDQLPSLRLEQMQKVKEMRARLKVAQEECDLRRSRQSVVCALPTEGNLMKLIRYETMLDRRTYRAYNEFRRTRAQRKANEKENA